VLAIVAVGGLLYVFRRPAPEPLAPPAPEMVYRPGITSLAPTPDWNRLKAYEGAITREDFLAELTDIYADATGEAAWKGLIAIEDDGATITTSPGQLLRIAFAAQSPTEPPERYWRTAVELPPVTDLAKQPLRHLRIAIDPGHIGGKWAQIEERWYKIPGKPTEVMEGELTLKTAQHLKPMLEKLGAKVALVRDSLEPVTPRRPADFRELAAAELRAGGIDPEAKGLPIQSTVDWNAEKLFYRSDEIRARAWRINEVIKPDVVLCLHFNAEAWANPRKPSFVPRNHLHLLVNGTYARGEIALEDNRLEMLERLFQRISSEEIALSTAVAASMAKETGLPPFIYLTANARQAGPSNYVYARNLLANRVYRCPVVFLEPYVMNNAEVYARVAAGDYEGTRPVAGKERPSIFREYAAGVAKGLTDYYLHTRHP
jgi:hypothetical protein